MGFTTRGCIRNCSFCVVPQKEGKIKVEGDFGSLKAVTNNIPLPENPRTSYLAALSAIATLKNIVSDSVIGN